MRAEGDRDGLIEIDIKKRLFSQPFLHYYD